MTLAMTGPHIQATGYRKGRARKRWPQNGITFLALHSAEGAKDEIELGNFFRNSGRASSNAGIGQDGGYASYVRYADTPWTNPPIHDDTETLEICGFARWTRRDWLAQPRMLKGVAQWIAWRAKVNGIPIRRIEGENLRRGLRGIVDHDGINDVFKQSSHWDLGESFPWDVVLDMARGLSGVTPAPKPEPVVPGSTYIVRRGDTYFTIATRAYGDGTLWPKIAKANMNRALQPGMVLSIPPKTAPIVAKIQLGPWPGYNLVRPGTTSNKIRLLQRKLRQVVGPKKAQELNPNGATGHYGPQTKALVRYALRKHPETWDTGEKQHDGVIGPKSWKVIAGL